MLQRHAPRVGADPCVCPPYLPILFVIVRAGHLLPSSRRGWGRWSAPTCGCARGGLGLCARRIEWLCPGQIEGLCPKRVEGGLPETGEFGAIFDRGGGVFRYSFLHCKDTKKSWNFQIVSRKNCTFGDKNCTFESFWCSLGKYRSSKAFLAISPPVSKAIKIITASQITVSQFYYEAYFCADASEESKNVSKNIYYLYII